MTTPSPSTRTGGDERENEIKEAFEQVLPRKLATQRPGTLTPRRYAPSLRRAAEREVEVKLSSSA